VAFSVSQYIEVESWLSNLNKGGFNMYRSKLSARLALSLITFSMLASAVTAILGWSVFEQAAVFGAGFILSAFIPHPTRPALLLASFYVACIFLLALIEGLSGSKVLSVWLYGGLVMPYWLQLQGKRRLRCRC
jgi:hypothetical protein